MSYNGAGVFLINSAGQPVVAGTTIQATVFNVLTADLASGLSNALCKDGQQTPTANIPFGGFKATNLGAATVNGDAVRYEQWRAAFSHIQEFRLTGTSATAVPTSDQTAITTVYLTPYKGNLIALYDGSTGWNIRSSAEISIAVPAVALGIYDVFCYDNSGVPTLELASWASATTRSTALVLQDGVLVKSGATTRRYLGSFATDAANHVVDSLAKRWLVNYYNRVRRPMKLIEATASWNYTTATWRQANGSTANQLDFLVGVDEDAVSVRLRVNATNTNVSVNPQVSLGLDSTSSPNANCGVANATVPVAGALVPLVAEATINTGIGRHFLAWIEYGGAAGTTTWFGTITVPMTQSGLTGEVLA